jgi:hypothetical protein
MKYQLARGIGGGVDACAAGEELERINETYNGLRPPEVVEESKPTTAVLHRCFEWRDELAGEQWRLHQARNLIRAVHVIDDVTGEARGAAFVHVTIRNDNEDEDSERAYLPVSAVVRDEDLFASAVSEIRSQIAGLQQSLGHLADANAKHRPRIQRAAKAVAKAQAAMAPL